ncbi:transcription repressor OFP14-like [Andrographis paniculata]|uniref:transcription repressor OFP14-like n=1 Tax=Andrographis paniculata TaxID=175694 RepID=UPI0021E93A37|nr:transcription repressor OFP14-like [Andrographis paniculata]
MAKSFQEQIAKIKLTRQRIQFSLHHRRNSKTTSLSARSKEKITAGVDRFASENSKSLCQGECERVVAEKSELRSILLESPRLEYPPPENLCRSDRFFISCGSSRSLITEEVSSSSVSSSAITVSPEASGGKNMVRREKNSVAADDYVALMTYSSDPYEDFRRSMQEMVEARLEHAGVADWKFLEELVFCYLNLNKKKAYGSILRAFVDLIEDLRENSGQIPAIC